METASSNSGAGVDQPPALLDASVAINLVARSRRPTTSSRRTRPGPSRLSRPPRERARPRIRRGRADGASDPPRNPIGARRLDPRVDRRMAGGCPSHADQSELPAQRHFHVKPLVRPWRGLHLVERLTLELARGVAAAQLPRRPLRAPLTTAELRILRFLPSHYSIPRIAAELRIA